MNDNEHTYLRKQLDELGDKYMRLRKAGICEHGWLNEQPDKTTCKLCGKEFDSFEDAIIEHAEILGL